MSTSRKIFYTLLVVIAVSLYVVTGCVSAARMNASTASIKRISDADFNTEVASSTTPVVVDFYATWCGPCKILSPMLDQLAGSYTNKIKFVKINLDEATNVAQQYSVDAIPTLLFFKHGQLVDRTLGLMDEPALKAKLNSFSTN